MASTSQPPNTTITISCDTTIFPAIPSFTVIAFIAGSETLNTAVFFLVVALGGFLIGAIINLICEYMLFEEAPPTPLLPLSTPSNPPKSSPEAPRSKATSDPEGEEA